MLQCHNMRYNAQTFAQLFGQPLMRFFQYFSHMTTGFVVVLVGYSSSVVIVIQAAEAAGASQVEAVSWLFALGIGMGISSMALSLYYRQPVLTAWSTPGAALLVGALPGVPLSDAIGAFICCALLTLLLGLSGWVERVVRYIPNALASAMLAGILLSFGLNAFAALEENHTLVGLLLLAYFGFKKTLPRYAIALVLCVGMGWISWQGEWRISDLGWAATAPIFTFPTFSLNTLIGVAIPLFVVNMASQNLPALAVLRAHGYKVPASPLFVTTAASSLLLAPFGGFSINLAAITAAICMSPEADPDPKQRFLASIWAGVFYLLAGFFAAAVVAIFLSFPSALVMAIAGLALLNTLANSLSSAFEDIQTREAAMVTFLATASGFSLLGIGSAFWGLLLGLIVSLLNVSPKSVT